MDICGTEAGITLPWAVHLMKESEGGFGARDEAKEQELTRWAEAQVPQPSYDGHAAQVRDMLDAINLGRPLAVTGEEGRKSIEVSIAIYKSALTGRPVELPIRNDDPYYGKVSEVLNRNG